MTLPELLLPAGNLKKLKCALYFGADAVYLGGKALSLRAFADNFSNDEIAEGVAYAHSLGKKVYITANVIAKNADLKYAEQFFAFLQDVGADAVLISDLGLLGLCKQAAPNLDIHISTQASVSNVRAVEMYKNLGAKRIVLARELSIAEIAEICHAVPDMQIEVFAHGAMCISYSGRCLLSSFLTGRSGNRGECAQPCRWQYNISDIRQGGDPLAVVEDEYGTYLLNSKDLNMLPRLNDLIAAGVSSLKVEGRMKSEFYVAAVAKAYRSVLDDIKSTGGNISPAALSRANELLDIISHRPYTQAFADGASLDTISDDQPKTQEKFSFITSVLGYENGYATVEMRNRFKTGDTLEVLSPSPSDGKKFAVGEILMKDGAITDDAKLVQYIYKIKCDVKLNEGDLLIKQK